MPGRKSNVSAVSNGPEEVTETTPAKASKEKDGLSVDVCVHVDLQYENVLTVL
jgi:hypothetical protein